MIDDSYFENNTKMYYKNKDYIYTFSDADSKDKSKELLLNDNSESQYMTMNRNLTVLRNKLHQKLDKSKPFSGGDIEYGPQGFVLVSPGDGGTPFWESPERVMASLKENELVDKEVFLLDYTTINSDLFTNMSNTTITNKIEFTSDDSYFYLKPFTINPTGAYQVFVELKPVQLDVIKTQAGVLYVRDTNLNDKDTFICVSDRGDIVLSDVVLDSDASGTKIHTTTTFSNITKAYVFNLKLNLDVFSGSRNFKTQHYGDMTLAYDKVYIKYSYRECVGDTIEFNMYGKKDTVIDKITIDLHTTDFIE